MSLGLHRVIDGGDFGDFKPIPDGGTTPVVERMGSRNQLLSPPSHRPVPQIFNDQPTWIPPREKLPLQEYCHLRWGLEIYTADDIPFERTRQIPKMLELAGAGMLTTALGEYLDLHGPFDQPHERVSAERMAVVRADLRQLRSIHEQARTAAGTPSDTDQTRLDLEEIEIACRTDLAEIQDRIEADLLADHMVTEVSYRCLYSMRKSLYWIAQAEIAFASARHEDVQLCLFRALEWESRGETRLKIMQVADRFNVAVDDANWSRRLELAGVVLDEYQQRIITTGMKDLPLWENFRRSLQTLRETKTPAGVAICRGLLREFADRIRHTGEEWSPYTYCVEAVLDYLDAQQGINFTQEITDLKTLIKRDLSGRALSAALKSCAGASESLQKGEIGTAIASLKRIASTADKATALGLADRATQLAQRIEKAYRG